MNTMKQQPGRRSVCSGSDQTGGFANRSPALRVFLSLRLLALVMVLAGAMPACDLMTGVLPDPDTPKAPTGPIGNDLDSATPITLTAAGLGVVADVVPDSTTAHVYDLGPCSPGDRIIVAVQPAPDSTLDPTIAIFDANGELFALNDDVDLDAGRLDSRIDEIVTVGSDHFFLAITKFFFDNQGGAYQGTIEIQRGLEIPVRPVQILLLNFASGEVTIPGEGTFTIDPFDAADIDPAYDGQTTQIKATIEATVRENFVDTGLQIITSDDAPPADGVSFSTIYFGAFSPTKFGVSESVDQGNLDLCDDGIVFTNDFDKPFASQPSAEGIAVAIGNVATHEAGHLLGLNHVADILALMDTTGTASTLLADQEFRTASLAISVFPFGLQNAPALLNRVIPP